MYKNYFNNFLTSEDDYVEDVYQCQMIEAYPKASFLVGWSAAPPMQEEAYALFRLEEE